MPKIGRMKNMSAETINSTQPAPKPPSVFSILANYRLIIFWLVLLAILANVLTLFLPKLVAGVIDSYIKHAFDLPTLFLEFGGFTIGIFVFTYLQSIVQTYASERVARDI